MAKKPQRKKKKTLADLTEEELYAWKRRHASVHEAGHVIVARQMGLQVSYANIRDSHDREGETGVFVPPGEKDYMALCVYALGGAAAILVAYGEEMMTEEGSGARNDMAWARRYAVKGVRQRGERPTQVNVAAFMIEATNRALNILRAQKDELRSLSDRLYERHMKGKG